ncbi:MAG: 2-aminoethylphosphonate aminotransferase [Deltaproteobacteria bacterium]
MYSVKRNILLNPGPATTTDSVKFAQVVPDICPREKVFGDLMESISTDITTIAGGDSKYTTILFGGSGTSAMDAVINSTMPMNKSILIINNGAYGQRMVEIARAYNINCVELKYEWDRLPCIEDIETALRNNPDIHAISMVHHETTSGLLNPIEKIGCLAQQYNKVFIVDTISSFAGVSFDIKKCNIDFMMSTSNKCIQGMAGISFVICRNEVLEKIKDYPRRSYYLSLYDQYIYFLKNHQMRFTPPVQTLYALRKAIDELFEEGISKRCERYTDNWKTLRCGLIELGYKIMTEPENESHILLTVHYPENPEFDFDKLHDALYEKGFTIYPGKIGKKNTFRLANMGAINSCDIKDFLTALKEITYD